MTNFDTIDVAKEEPFLITWDLGRRCNYDCSYCPPHRHDNSSSHASWESLANGVDFIFEYAELMSQYRKSKDITISFTGGEPTVHPKFIEFAKYIRQQYVTNYKNKFNLYLDLTTNGAMSKRIALAVIENFNHVTVSYHAEAVDKLKSQVINRIDQFADSSIGLKINVMLHAQYFEECKKLCETLRQKQINFVPRAIGEDPDSRSKFAHSYTQEQIDWFQKFWGVTSQASLTGRPCCGGRTFKTCGSSGENEVKFINFRKFKDWHCSVNWFFLHVEQQTDSVYHHQTCQATFDGRGSIGKISEGKKIINTFKNQLESKTMPIISCPNQFCGCGLCTPKSSDIDKLLAVLPNTISDMSIFNLSLPTSRQHTLEIL